MASPRKPTGLYPTAACVASAQYWKYIPSYAHLLIYKNKMPLIAVTIPYVYCLVHLFRLPRSGAAFAHHPLTEAMAR